MPTASPLHGRWAPRRVAGMCCWWCSATTASWPCRSARALASTPRAVAGGIITEAILPEFAADNPVAGLRAGVEAVAERVLTVAASSPAPEAGEAGEAGGGSGILYYLGGGVVALIGLVTLLNRRSAAKLAATPCPACGKTSLTRERVTLVQPSPTAEGRGETRTTCSACGHMTAERFAIPKLEAKPEPEKGKGGSAKGQW
jgi:uncharacterized protein